MWLSTDNRRNIPCRTTSIISHQLGGNPSLWPLPEAHLAIAPPASDFICGALQTAAGMNLHVFTTGEGTPYGLAMVRVT
jgi:hypothetical protein